MRREQSSINLRSHPDIMMLSLAGSSHPYLCARVISTFHVNAFRLTPDAVKPSEPQLLQVLWPFGFISPEQVLHDSHIVPAPFYGRSESRPLPHRVIARPKRAPAEADDDIPQDCYDWKYYYVGMWSDRDLFMRYLGDSVGHEYMHDGGEFQIASMMPALDEDVEVAAPPTTQNAHAQEDEAALDEEEPEGPYKPSDIEGGEGDEDEDGERDGDDDMELDEGVQDPDDEESEPDLGPEDGEGDDELDDYEANSYAPY
ncbi:hypothetical protein C8T65DRAFT_739253 [Cerioporus squamosus]|nr:hypothetical protein C8T65DRAFT_739253 [Cerioporus squamosus]